MRTVTVRELCRDFSRKVEAPLRRGETLILGRWKEVIGAIVSVTGAGVVSDIYQEV